MIAIDCWKTRPTTAMRGMAKKRLDAFIMEVV
jgi:hypothetical protein